MYKKNSPKKELGQNFLKSENTARLMVNNLEIGLKDNIIEIGPGRAALTKFLTDQPYKSLTLYEIDESLKDDLEKLVHGKAQLIMGNFLDMEIIYEQPYKIIGSLPYYITSPIIHKILKLERRPETMIFLVQKEVGDKMLDKAPDASYWTHVTAGYNVEKVKIVKAEEFYPIPKVDSMIIKLTRDKQVEKRIINIGFRNWEKFLHHAYRNPRKMLSKAFSKDLLEKAKVKPTDRPQNLTLQNLFDIYELK